jgi:hypothetical protein
MVFIDKTRRTYSYHLPITYSYHLPMTLCIFVKAFFSSEGGVQFVCVSSRQKIWRMAALNLQRSWSSS